MDLKTVLASLSIVMVLIYAFGSGAFMDNSGWYQSLNRPRWQPPSFIFGLIWPYNFVVLGISSFQVIRDGTVRTSATYFTFLTLSVIAALTWAYFFYRPHDLAMASISLSFAALFTLPLLVLTLQSKTLLGFLMIPYQGWLITAAALSISYWRLN
jgi:benzodiazapine receptor